MLIFKEDKIVCHLGNNRMVALGTTTNEFAYRNYELFFTLQVNGALKDIRTVIGKDEKGFYVQDEFVAVVNVLKSLGYNVDNELIGKIYKKIHFDITTQGVEKD